MALKLWSRRSLLLLGTESPNGVIIQSCVRLVACVIPGPGRQPTVASLLFEGRRTSVQSRTETPSPELMHRRSCGVFSPFTWVAHALATWRGELLPWRRLSCGDAAPASISRCGLRLSGQPPRMTILRPIDWRLRIRCYGWCRTGYLQLLFRGFSSAY